MDGAAKMRVRSSAAPEEFDVMQISFPIISYSHNNKISNKLKVIKGPMKEKSFKGKPSSVLRADCFDSSENSAPVSAHCKYRH